MCDQTVFAAVTHQRTGPGIREAGEFVSVDIETAEGLQAVQYGGGKICQAVIGHVQLLQLTQADPVSACSRKTADLP